MCPSCRRAATRRCARLASVMIAAVLFAIAVTGGAQTGTAVEYYHAAWEHYFVTAFPDEIALLDQGAFGGVWRRTGETFPVATQPGGAFADTCRFFSVSFAPRSAHFYTPFAEECERVKASSDWQFESIAFHLGRADAAGTCASGMAPLYRLYNNGAGGAPNHRYTTSRATFDQMVARGWTAEGNGAGTVFACVPAATPSSDAAGIYTGVSSANESILAIVLPEGRYYIVHSVPGGGSDRGIVNGTATTAEGRFGSSDGFDYTIASGIVSGDVPRSMAVDGTYTAKASLDLLLGDTIAAGSRTFAAVYVASSDQPSSLDAAAGRYTATFGHVGGRRTARFSVDAAGNLAGASDAARAGETTCRFAGTLTPRDSIAVFDWTVASTGGECIFGAAGDAISGIAYYDPVSQQLRGFAPFFGRTDMFYLIGVK